MKQLQQLAMGSLLLILLLSNLVTAQSDLPENEKAIACIDIRYAKLREGELATAGQLDEFLNTMIEREGPDLPFGADKFERVFGAVSAPESMMSLMQMGGADDLPMNFFVEIHLSDKESTDLLFEEIPTTGTLENDGKTYHGLGLTNVLLHRKDSTTIVVGTKGASTQTYSQRN